MSTCWAWTVSVMATCETFFADLASSPLSVCNATIDGPNTGAFSFAVYQERREAAAQGRDANAPACTGSHGQCSEHCATQFNLLWRDHECSKWLQDYVRVFDAWCCSLIRGICLVIGVVCLWCFMAAGKPLTCYGGRP